MAYSELTIREMKAQDDGRLTHLSCINGQYSAAFNIYPYSFERITKEQFEKYKPLCTKVSSNLFECAVHDNGFPSILNKIF